MKEKITFLLVLLLAASCTDKFFTSVGEMVDTEGNVVSHDMIVLGSQLEDPYSLQNMSDALASLYPTKSDRVVMEPTDLYVRFLPEDDDQFDMLEEMGLQLIDHPVDYEIVREGDYYHDPEIPKDGITWQYAVVDADFVFPDWIKYEILDRCYIPDDSSDTKGPDGIDWETVEREAFRITGNGKMLNPLTKGESGSPEGRITIEDDKLPDDTVGVKGVKVSCNCFVKFGNAYTDEKGYYSMTKTFSSDPRYRIVFKNKQGFGIGFNLLLVPASFSTLGKNSASGIDVKVTKGSERKLFTRCAVNNAAYDYYESCSDGDFSMKTPPSNLRIWLFQNLRSSSSVMLQQGVMVDDGIIADYLGEYTFLLKMFLPDVTIGLKGCDDFASIYSLTVHEMAHASHFMIAGKAYWNSYVEFILKSFVSSGFVTYGVGTEEGHGYCEVGEMWAYYLQSRMYRDRYGFKETVFGTSYWFYPQILLYLEDRGLTRFKIFNALGPDVNDRDVLQKKLINLYPQLKSAINQAFTRY